MAKGNYDAAQALAHEAEGLRVQLQAGEDTPQKLLEDISHARTITATSSDPKLLVSSARDAYNRGNLDEAERNLTEAARLVPSSPEVNEHLGDLYQRKHKPEEARAAWRKALSLSLEAEQTTRLKSKLAGATKK